MSSEKIIHCHRSDYISIDEIDESAFAHIDVSEPLNLADGAEPPQSIATRVGMEWNDNALLVYFRGRFEELHYATEEGNHNKNNQTDRLWELSDVFQVFIGTHAKETKRYKEFQVSPDSRWMDSDVNRQVGVSNHYWYSGMRCQSIIDNDLKIWTSILELPWNCFGMNKRIDDIWNVNFYRASGKYHGEELLAWSATGYGEKCFHRPEHFGSIEFSQ